MAGNQNNLQEQCSGSGCFVAMPKVDVPKELSLAALCHPPLHVGVSPRSPEVNADFLGWMGITAD